MLILDTNMILRFLLNDNEEMANKTAEIISTREILVLPEVIAEVVYVMHKTYKNERDYTAKGITRFLNLSTVSAEHKDIIIKGLQYFADTSLDFVDCLLCAYHTEAGYEIGTFDNKLLKLIQRESEPKEETNSEDSQTE